MDQTPTTGHQPGGESIPSLPQPNSHTEQATHLLGARHPGAGISSEYHPTQESQEQGFKIPTNPIDLHSYWIGEIFSFAAAGVLFGIFFYLLFRYDGQLVSRWEQDSPISGLFRTLQSAISFITTIMKAAILFPVVSALGQLKWHNTRRASRVKDIELIDGAS